MMKKSLLFIAIVALILCSCCPDERQGYTEVVPDTTLTFSLHWGDVERFVDEEAGVVCWIYTSNRSTKGSISCLSIEQTRLDR
jgi:hypothetical protein